MTDKERHVKICPRCGSTNIITNTGRYLIGGIELLKDNCGGCGYEGFIPEVKESKIERFREDLGKKKTKPKSYPSILPDFRPIVRGLKKRK